MDSLARLKLPRGDLFFLHDRVVPDDQIEHYRGTPRSLFVEAVVPAFERLIASGRIGGWAISGLGVPSAVVETLSDDPPPTAVQAIANLLDSGDESYGSPEPGPREIIASAEDRGVAVMGINQSQLFHQFVGPPTSGLGREAAQLAEYSQVLMGREVLEGLGLLRHDAQVFLDPRRLGDRVVSKDTDFTRRRLKLRGDLSNQSSFAGPVWAEDG